MMKINNTALKSKTCIFLSIFVLSYLFCAVTPVQAETASSNDLPVLVVSAQSTVTASPDQASVSLAVIGFDKDLNKAQKTNNTNTERVIASLLENGIEKENIETSNYTIQPQYNYESKGSDLPEIIGYRVRNEVSVTVKDIDTLGTVLDSAVKAGANNINYINFEKSDTSALEDKALAQAVSRAQSKAKVIAEAADVNIVRILSINEGNVYINPPVPLRYADMGLGGAEGAAKSSQVPIQPGQIEVTATVTIAYEIK